MHCSHGSSTAAHAGPFVGSARARQPGWFVPTRCFPVASKRSAPALVVVGKRQPAHPAKAVPSSSELQAACVAVPLRHDARNDERSLALHAFACRTTGT